MNWKYFNEAVVIDNGAYSDPQLMYKGKVFNYYTMEDTIYFEFKESMEEQGLEVSEAEFEAYCSRSQDSIRELFEELKRL